MASRPVIPQTTVSREEDDIGATSASLTKLDITENTLWSDISATETQLILNNLSKACHSETNLLNHNYVLRPLTDKDISNLEQCRHCKHKKIKKPQECLVHPGRFKLVAPTDLKAGQRARMKKVYDCCGTSGRGCSISVHEYRPPPDVFKYRTLAYTPKSRQPKRQAVVLDCEMAGVQGNRQEAIYLCAVDFITGEVLINHLVLPNEKVFEWRSSCHGITRQMMEKAATKKETLLGWNGARNEVWKYIDDNTILVGHALQHDLDVLRMIHTKVVDSAVLTQHAVGCSRQWGLSTLCEELAGIPIRKNVKGIHDCLEDVMATREVVLQCVRNTKTFEKWVHVQKLEEERKAEERAVATAKKMAKKIAAVEKDIDSEDGGVKLE